MDFKKYEDIASRIRIDIIKAVHKAGSGHPGGSLSAADIVTALYFKEMRIDPQHPRMEGRDKFILSKGHAGPVQYAALAERGYFPVEAMMSLRKLGRWRTAGGADLGGGDGCRALQAGQPLRDRGLERSADRR